MAWSTPRTWTNGEIVTQTELNTDVRDNMREQWHEVSYVEFTADASATNVAETAAGIIVSAGAITHEAVPHLIEFFCPGSRFSVPVSGTAGVSLWDSTTDLGRLYIFDDSNKNPAPPLLLRRRLTPTAASHTYNIRLWAAGTASAYLHAGAGGAGSDMPGYIRILAKGGA